MKTGESITNSADKEKVEIYVYNHENTSKNNGSISTEKVDITELLENKNNLAIYYQSLASQLGSEMETHLSCDTGKELVASFWTGFADLKDGIVNNEANIAKVSKERLNNFLFAENYAFKALEKYGVEIKDNHGNAFRDFVNEIMAKDDNLLQDRPDLVVGATSKAASSFADLVMDDNIVIDPKLTHSLTKNIGNIIQTMNEASTNKLR